MGSVLTDYHKIQTLKFSRSLRSLFFLSILNVRLAAAESNLAVFNLHR